MRARGESIRVEHGDLEAVPGAAPEHEHDAVVPSAFARPVACGRHAVDLDRQISPIEGKPFAVAAEIIPVWVGVRLLDCPLLLRSGSMISLTPIIQPV